MPRLTNSDYLARRRTLRFIWTWKRELFAQVHPTAQQDLHLYFKPSEKGWSEHDLIEYRLWIGKKYPSLPSAAGKYYASLIQAVTTGVPGPGSFVVGGRKHKVSVRALAKAEVDVDLLVRVLLELDHEKA